MHFVLIAWSGCTQASSEHSVCFAVPEKEAQTVAKALESKFRRALDAGRLSKVFNVSATACCLSFSCNRSFAFTFRLAYGFTPSIILSRFSQGVRIYGKCRLKSSPIVPSWPQSDREWRVLRESVPHSSTLLLR